MLNIHLFRKEPELVKTALKNRGQPTVVVDEIISLDATWREVKSSGDELKADKNKISLEVATLKKAGKSADKQIKALAVNNERIKELDIRSGELEAKINDLLLAIPNIPHASAPVGPDASGNKVVRVAGKPPKFDFKPLDHHELGEKLGLLDFVRGSKLSGHRFVVMKGELARLERAITNFFLDVARERGYAEHWTPYLVTTKTITGTGQLPKFKEEQYKVEGEDLWLIPTGEVPLTNLHADEILEEKALPLHYCAYTPCFRREAGAYGKDIRGMIRQHQFDKVELVKITSPETSYEEHEKMLKDAEEVLKRLGLPYRVVLLCTGDMGFSAAKTYDVEVWLPSQGKYREISSVSNCEDFQARRMNSKYWKKGKPEFVHTLNGSGVAVGRTLIAIMENFQHSDGSISIPPALQPYLGGLRKIG